MKAFTSLFSNRRKKKRDLLLNAFGKLKDETFDFEFIEDYFRKKDKTEAFHVLSEKTCNDLDFQELFMFIDRTNSKVGQQFLYNTLRTIPSDSKATDIHEKLIAKFTENENLRVHIQDLLCRLNNTQTFYINTLFQDEHLKKPKLFFIVQALSLISLISIVMLFINPVMFFVLAITFVINLFIHYRNKKNLYQYLGSIPQLLIMNKIAKALMKIPELDNIKGDAIQSISSIDSIRNRMSFFKLKESQGTPIEIILGYTLEIIKVLFLLEPLMLFEALEKLDAIRKDIENVYTFVGKTDVLISIASLRQGLTLYCRPEMNYKNSSLKVSKLYHPLIVDCIPNSIEVHQKSVLLSGSNMSGKTSFIRSIGINAIAGLTLNTCFCRQCSLPRFKIFSAIRISDDLMNNKSYYFEEVQTIKTMIEKSEKDNANLFLLDEIFKGTNTIERISAGKAVLSYLTKGNSIVFVSTHDIELADLLKDTYELYHFSEKIDQKTVAFDYKLKEGKLQTRNAIRILQINDYPDSVIDEAMEISQVLDAGINL